MNIVGVIRKEVIVGSIKVKDDHVSDVYQGKRKHIILRGCRFKKDDPLFLYTQDGQRRLRSTRCDDVREIHISSNTVVIMDNGILNEKETRQLAIDDGFDDFNAFMKSYKSRRCLPFEGQVVRWL